MHAGPKFRDLLIGILACISIAHAELPQPSLLTIFPAGGQQGQTVEVKITGTDLDAASLRFTTPDITAKVDAKDSKKFSLSIGKDLKPGRYDVRVTNKLGVSNPRAFEVGTITEVFESDKNDKRETAHELTLPVLVNGTAGSQQDDWFKVSVKKDQLISFQCIAQELDSKMVPQLTLFDEAGHELINERRTARIEWLPRTDGVLTLRLNDLIYKGGAEFWYRLTVGTGRHIESTSHAPEPARTLMLPVKTEGTFSASRTPERFKFTARKGEVWWIDVVSERLGMKTNPRVIVQHAGKDVLELNDGSVLPGLPDYDGNHLDPTGKLEIKEDGDYELTIRDLSRVVNQNQRRYQLLIRKPAPDFRLIAIPVPPSDNKPGKDFNGPVVKVWNHNIHRGEVMPVKIIIERTDGFDGEIKLSASELPAGIKFNETSIRGDIAETMCLISADEKATAGITTLKISGTSGTVTREARGTTTLWNLGVNEFIEPSRWRFTDEILMGVVEDPVVPVQVQVSPARIEAEANAKVKLTLTVVRQTGFNEAVKLKPAGISRIERSKDAEFPAGTDRIEYELEVETLKLSAGIYPFWFRGDVKLKANGKDATASIFGGPVVLVIKQPL